MQIKKIIANVATILGFVDVTELVNGETSDTVLMENQNYNILFRCANLVAANVAGNYRDCVTIQKFTVTDGKIEFSQFNKNFMKAIDVKCNGAVADFDIYINFLKVPNGMVEVTYAYVPVFTSGNDEARNILSEAAFVYGILAEYSFISGMFNEAKVFNAKFEELLFGMLKTGRTIKMPRS